MTVSATLARSVHASENCSRHGWRAIHGMSSALTVATDTLAAATTKRANRCDPFGHQQHVETDRKALADEHAERDAEHRLPEVDGRRLDPHRTHRLRGACVRWALYQTANISHRGPIAADVCGVVCRRDKTSAVTAS